MSRVPALPGLSRESLWDPPRSCPSPCPRPPLVLALGNDVLSDDGAALRVARQLGAQGPRDVDIRESSEAGLALLDLVAGRERVVVIDAIVTGRVAPGTILELKLADLCPIASPSPHYAGLPEILGLAARLGLGVPHRLRILAMEVADATTLGSRLTPAVEAALPALLARVRTALDELTE